MLIMKYFIALIYVVHHSWALIADKSWNNYETTNLRNWNNEVAVNGLFFSANLVNPMAFYSHYDDVCQLIIPMNSEANDTNFSWTPIDFDTGKQVSCPDQESGNTWWVDPRNWDSSATSNATPHLERIPCAYESVVFKPMNDLYVMLPTNPVKVRRFSWNEQTIHTYNFNATLRDERFLKNFIVTGQKDIWDMIKITAELCQNQTGCECGTLIHYKETCKILRNQCDMSLTCANPIMPTGHCCNICGCSILINFDPNTFVYVKLEAVVKKIFSDKDSLSYHMSRLAGDEVQIVIIDEGASDNYDDMHTAALKLRNVLSSSDVSLSHLTSSILSVQMFCSYKPSSYESLASVSRFMIPLFAIASLAILIVLLFQSKLPALSKIQDIFKSSVAFVKFDNQFEKGEEQSQSQKQPEQESAQPTEVSKNIEPELHSEGKSENGTSSELDDDSVLVELT